MEYKSPRGTDSAAKAEFFGAFIREHGWKGKYDYDEDTGETHLWAKRGENERLDVYWQRNGSMGEGRDPIYTLAGDQVKLRNLSAMAKIAAAKPDGERLQRAIRKKRKASDVPDGGYTPEMMSDLQVALPFDDESSDEEIVAILDHAAITWINRMSGDTESGIAGSNHLEVVRREDGRHYVNFCDLLGGFFRSVYLSSIVSVG